MPNLFQLYFMFIILMDAKMSLWCLGKLRFITLLILGSSLSRFSNSEWLSNLQVLLAHTAYM